LRDLYSPCGWVLLGVSHVRPLLVEVERYQCLSIRQDASPRIDGISCTHTLPDVVEHFGLLNAVRNARFMTPTGTLWS